MSSKWKNKLKIPVTYLLHNIIPLVLCTIGAAIQVTTLVTMYFSFPTSNIIELYAPDYVSLPGISVCYIHHFPAAKTFAQMLGKENVTEENYRFILSVDELNQFSASYEDFVRNCEIFSVEDNRKVPCSNFSTVTTFINANSKCFTFFRNIEYEIIYFRNEFEDERIMTMELELNVTAGRFFIALHETNEELHFEPGSPGVVFVDHTQDNKYVAMFISHTINKLGSPYSNCKQYIVTDKNPRTNVIYRCMQDKIFEDHKRIYSRNFVPIPNNYGNATFEPNIEMHKYRTICENIYYQPECHSKVYEILLLQSFYSESFDRGIARVEFVYPRALQSNITMVKKLDQIEYFCYVASVVNLWLEISILTVVKFAFKNLRKFTPKLIEKIKASEIDLLSHHVKQKKMRKKEAFKKKATNKLSFGPQYGTIWKMSAYTNDIYSKRRW